MTVCLSIARHLAPSLSLYDTVKYSLGYCIEKFFEQIMGAENPNWISLQLYFMLTLK